MMPLSHHLLAALAAVRVLAARPHAPTASSTRTATTRRPPDRPDAGPGQRQRDRRADPTSPSSALIPGQPSSPRRRPSATALNPCRPPDAGQADLQVRSSRTSAEQGSQLAISLRLQLRTADGYDGSSAGHRLGPVTPDDLDHRRASTSTSHHATTPSAVSPTVGDR